MPRKSSSNQESQPEEQSAEAQSDQAAGQSQSDGDSEGQVEQAVQQVDEAVQSETDQGYRGVRVDQTPDEHYTVEGVTSGKPVPEAEADPVAARREATNPDA
jgi:hypothetical protein